VGQVRKKRSLANTLLFLATTYVYGVLLGIFFYFLRVAGIIRVIHSERFPRWQRKLILVSNHPSLLEPFLLPALFFREYLFHPLKYAPWSTPDVNNFYREWYWFWIRPRAIPIDRSQRKKENTAFFQIKEVLDAGEIVILFPEGGRTYKGKEFLYSKKGKKIRRLKNGIGLLVAKTKALVLPVWVESTDGLLPCSLNELISFLKLRGKITIKIGGVLNLANPCHRKESITRKIEEALLKLADEPI